MYALTTQNLSKQYPDGKLALDNLNIELNSGEVFGFLGPNGAGKTTTVKLLTGILSPTRGNCTIFGIDPSTSPEKAHELCGIVTEYARMYDGMTAMKNLLFYASVFGIDSTKAQGRAEALLSELDLSDSKDKKLSSFSTGMRQRLSLARALIHEPKILFLDEPTSGLDPESAQNVNSMISRLAKEKGITVFLCTHQLRYAQEICARYGLIGNGHLIAVGTLDSLRTNAFSSKTLKIRASAVPEELNLKLVEGEYQMQISSEQEVAKIVKSIVNFGGAIYSVTTLEPNLEDIYFALNERAKGGKK